MAGCISAHFTKRGAQRRANNLNRVFKPKNARSSGWGKWDYVVRRNTKRLARVWEVHVRHGY